MNDENGTVAETPRLNFGATAEGTAPLGDEVLETNAEDTADATVELNPVTEEEAVAETQVHEEETAVIADAPNVAETDTSVVESEVVTNGNSHPAEVDTADLQPAAVDVNDEVLPVSEDEAPLAQTEATTEETSPEVESTETLVSSSDEVEAHPDQVKELQQEVAQVEQQLETQDELPTITGDDNDASTPSVAELTERKADLERQITERQSAEKQAVMSQIKSVVSTYNISNEELVEFLGGVKLKRAGVKAKPKYRNPADGTTWSGRGKAPAWIKDQDRTPFLITE